MTNRNRWYVKLNRQKTIGYFDSKDKADRAADVYRRYGFKQAKVFLQF